ncbi:hypothetical protein RND71_034309 [Anisodus tanguticus]|uniref:Uncharacterized protein n=1 Tax=Anisodus tanguticus TaxID=243964 RepID=A0AAE1RAA4_9SOLA|nr:hypothetical protein RND71_034309 [Anisodus tanguticus]
MVANADDGVKDVTRADSPVSVPADEHFFWGKGYRVVRLQYVLECDTCKEELAVKLVDEVFLDAKNGDVSLLFESMAKEEESLIKTRAKEEEFSEEIQCISGETKLQIWQIKFDLPGRCGNEAQKKEMEEKRRAQFVIEQIVGQCGKFRLLDRLLSELFARKQKVLMLSQWTKVLDIMDYYFSERGFDVCRIDGSVKLDERKRQDSFQKMV